MISADEFARAYRQESAEEWAPLPAVITAYDAGTEIATVVPLIQQIYRDGSTIDLPLIHGVPIWSPRSASAGLKLPITVGDKVLLIFTMRSLDNLLDADLSGTTLPAQVDPQDNKFKDYSFCVGLAGFNDENSAIGTDAAVHLLNNWQKTEENRLRLEGNGDILLSNAIGSAAIAADGDILINNEVGSASITPDGTITVSNAAGSMTLSPSGNLTIVAPADVNITAPTVTMSGNLTVAGTVVAVGTVTGLDCIASNKGTVLSAHLHPGDGGTGSGPDTGPPI